MQFPKLTPLQSRFAVSLTASVILVVIYFFLWNPHFAYAAELDGGDGVVRGGDDHNWARIAEDDDVLVGDWQYGQLDLEEEGGVAVEEELETEQAFLERRAAAGVNTLDANNSPGNLNIDPGKTQVWLFPNTTLWANYTNPGVGLPSEIDEDDDGDDDTFFKALRAGHNRNSRLYKRQDTESRTVYISINTCLQPTWNASSTQSSAPPQLTLYVSNSTSNVNPGPNVTNGTQFTLPLDEGFANFSMNATEDLYMSISAPDLPTNFTGEWNYNLVASIDDYYYGYHDTNFLHLVDTDTNQALLVTDNLTQANPGDTVYQQWMNLSTPFVVFAQSTDDKSIWGVRNSICGLQTVPAQILANTADPGGVTDNVQMGMVTRGMGNKPKEQFYIKSLNASSTYEVFLAMQGNSTASGAGVVGGGGQVWPAVKLNTKQDGNCALIFNLTFCSEVAYAVPSNPNTFPSLDSLSAVYDSYAAGMYQNFNYSLQQIPCNTTSSAQYSLAKTCDDCAAAYKQWLCAVTMPRCEDFSANMAWLQPRNMAQRFINSSSLPPTSQFLQQDLLNAPYVPMNGAPGDSAAWSQTYASVFASNSSRNPDIIDQTIMPGPYKEVLPCDDLCYSLVQSCPASFGFGCPTSGRGLELDYGKRSGDSSNLTCSYLGAVYYLNDAGRIGSSGFAILIAGLVSLVLVLGV